jgi:flagellar hook-associated protein 2
MSTSSVSGTSSSGVVSSATSSAAATSSSLPIGTSTGNSLPTTGLITDNSLGSGVNVDSLVTQLVAAAAAPGNSQIQAEQTQYQTQLAAISGLQTAVTTFQSAVQGLATTSAFTAYTATPSDASVFAASASSTATPGTYSVTVNKLATQEQLSSAVVSGGATGYVGTGSLNLTQNGTTVNLTIDSSNDTLDGIVSAINSASNNPGINASVVTTSGGSVLFLTSATTGAKGAITVTSSGGDGGLAQFNYPPATGSTTGLTLQQAAQNADVTIAGLDVTSATNTITNALPGVTLNLLTTSPTTTTGTTTTATPQTLTVADDTTTTTTQVNAFVSAYNTLQSEMASLGSYNASTGAAGPLLGDPLLLNLQNEIKSNLFATVSGISGGLNSLASIGITPDSSGQLQVDNTTLQNALNSNYQAVGNVFGSNQGIAATLATTLTGVLGPTGSLQSRTNTLNTEMTASQTAQTQLNQQMSVLQSTYLTQFTALDTLLADFQSTASFLTTQLADFSTAATVDSLA